MLKKCGCKDCFYQDEEERMMDILKSFVDFAEASQYAENLKDDITATKWAINKIETLKENEECLHCGSEKASYCEKCYQELIAENLRLQNR